MDGSQLIASRYEIIDTIGKGGMGVVYRVLDRLTGQTVALKKVLIQPEKLHTPLEALAREFQTLASLRHPNIISVLDFGFDAEISEQAQNQNLPFFTMDLFDGAQNIAEAGQQYDTVGKMRLVIQILESLAYLHQHGIIHRDLKPANILVNAAGEVKVLDFGIAITSAAIHKRAGSIAYAAPEVFRNDPISHVSDLYAVGMIAYELLTGEYPFKGDSTPALIENILLHEPDLTLIDKVDAKLVATGANLASIPPSFETRDIEPLPHPPTASPQPANKTEAMQPLSVIIGRLLAKYPNQRYQNAFEVIQHLCAALDLPLPAESAAIRASFLEAAPFVGRTTELNQLQTALIDAMAGKGRAILVGGESGVGKSRLLDELRIQALVSGGTVLRGQGVEGGGLPYQTWREPLRRLALMTPLDDLSADILQAVVPDIAALLGREIPPVPALSGKTAQDRLHLTIIELFKRQTAPIVLLLEDLQWADDSLPVLQALLRVVDSLPLLIIGSYRDDEQPALPTQLAGMEVLKLARLTESEMTSLCAAILGKGIPQERPEVVDLIRKETEGNTFFMVEVVRALAEEAGRLDDIGVITLPETVFVQSMEQLVQRRLGRVPAWGQAMLQRAAVAGRWLDSKVLAHLWGGTDTTHPFDQWLLACTAVLEVAEGRWRFAHDKLREGVLREIGEVAPLLHCQIAEAIETVYPNDAMQADVLMEHWRAGGEPHKEYAYLLIVTERLLELTADYARAEKLLVRGLTLIDDERPILLNQFDEVNQRPVLLNRLSIAQWRQGKYDAARTSAEEALSISEKINDQTQLAKALSNLGVIAGFQGKLDEAIGHHQGSLAISRSLNDQKPMAACLNNLGAIAGMQGDLAAAEDYQQQTLEIQRAIGNQQGVVYALNNLGALARTRQDFEANNRYLQESLAISRAIGDQYSVAFSLNSLGQVANQRGDYAAARPYLEECSAIRRMMGDQAGMGFTLANLGYSAEQQNDLADAHRYYAESLKVREGLGNQLAIADTLNDLSRVALKQGDGSRAKEYLARGLKASRENVPIWMTLALIGTAARVALHMGEATTAARYMGLVLHHSGTQAVTKTELEELRPALESTLGKDGLEAALERGKSAELATVVEEILGAGDAAI